MNQPVPAFMSTFERRAWTAAQLLVFLIGAGIVLALLVRPALGLYLLWDVLIPVAPLLLVMAPGVWRNVCPLGTFSILPARMRLSRRRVVSRRWQSRLFAGAVGLLLLIVPLRHVVLDLYGVATGIVLLAAAALALGLGVVFDWKSAWCSGLCPVYPVELLYGSRPLLAVKNAHCSSCSSCVSPCRDSSPGATPQTTLTTGAGRGAAILLVGGFPGFVLGWYLVKLEPSTPLPTALGTAYAHPLAGMLVSALLYAGFARLRPRATGTLSHLFAALAVAIYYWFKLPVMLGLEGDGSHALPGLHGLLPDWSIWLVRIVSSVGLLLFLSVRSSRRGWQIRPARRATRRAALNS